MTSLIYLYPCVSGKCNCQNGMGGGLLDDALYRVWDHWIADGKRPVVFSVNVEKGTHRNLFAGAKRSLPVSGGSASDYDVSPDGKEICFTSESAKELGMDYNLDLYVMPIDTNRDRKGALEPKNITADNPGNDFAPVYSPDGRSIAFSRQTTKYFYADRVRIMVHDCLKGANREVAKDFDRSCSPCQWCRVPGALSEALVFEAEDKGQHRIYLTFTGFGNPVAEKPVAQTYSYSDLAPSYSNAKGGSAAFLRSSFGLPASLFFVYGQSKKEELQCAPSAGPVT